MTRIERCLTSTAILPALRNEGFTLRTEGPVPQLATCGMSQNKVSQMLFLRLLFALRAPNPESVACADA